MSKFTELFNLIVQQNLPQTHIDEQEIYRLAYHPCQKVFSGQSDSQKIYLNTSTKRAADDHGKDQYVRRIVFNVSCQNRQKKLYTISLILEPDRKYTQAQIQWSKGFTIKCNTVQNLLHQFAEKFFDVFPQYV